MFAVMMLVYCAPAYIVNDQSVSIQDSIALSKEIDSLHMGYDRGYQDGIKAYRYREGNINGCLLFSNCLLSLAGGVGGCIVGINIAARTDAPGAKQGPYYALAGTVIGSLVASAPLTVNATKKNIVPKHMPLGDSLYTTGFLDGYRKSKHKGQLVSAVLGAVIGVSFPIYMILMLSYSDWGY